MITFSTKYHADIPMFDAVGKQFLTLMEQSERVPGALKPEQVAAAMQSLQTALSQREEVEDSEDEKVALSTRAKPLLELLQSALDNNEYVQWR
ncbi:DUF1840 family protein [Paraferrimonas sedimenticola]|uniref:DUF1840 domain-containing protein n=1 Tax=Paraferrimonas sedimenticola TaxID=375674 RepID=A0AA37VU45_9GAMM|nr:DUF1840 family protein [Paraferrimonas sedimenticola]GLP95471.1 hypothetical protein GCM10007895_07770 [Paraferrimonas sedimenticola]